ncbi:GNAT family N-acetyltransferase [Marinilactibacillus sp. 15R]|uniref:GNAT family N-acetyltransferase n=1 Tax=Marinilactibacillus sp. 15R TaxID=1911586 RepID=UPI00090A598B|nr:GNAT family N-acetyltransferase [Marinilactibacillus sp. 15R]API88247.1 GNAT family N-acetyltransferase [Marinilactibacillus sp. 15R]
MLRKIRLSDAERIRKINIEELGYEVSIDLVNQQIKKLSNDSTHHYFSVYEDEETANTIGYVHAEIYESLYAEPMFNVMALAVDKDHHKKGIGKVLMQALEKEALLRGLTGVRLNSGEIRTEAHKFYEHIGSESNKYQKRFVKFL